jgi:predicted TIM-barrel fold metal-dependent hydrolase
MNYLSPELPIVDAHQHFWNPELNYHPWLCDEPPIPFRYGNYESLRRPYLPEHYLRDAAPRRVAATVYVEAEWRPGDAVAEMQWIADLRRATGYPSVAVAQAWLDQADIATQLSRLKAFDFVRSVRHKPRANANPQDETPGGMTDAAFRSGFSQLGAAGLRFDLQTSWWHLHEAVTLARDFPDVQIIVNHTALPADRSREGLARWRNAIEAAAQCTNIALKISGLGVKGERWTVEANRDIVLAAIEAFGVARCMFASNFPVDSLCASFSEIYDGFATIVQDLSFEDQRALFHDNAMRIYAISSTTSQPAET